METMRDGQGAEGIAGGGRTDRRHHFPARPAARGKERGTLPLDCARLRTPLTFTDDRRTGTGSMGGMSISGHEELRSFVPEVVVHLSQGGLMGRGGSL